MFPDYYEFCNKVKVNSGFRALENLAFELQNLKAHKPIILSNQILVDLGLVKKVLSVLEGFKTGPLFVDIPADSSIEVVNQIAGIFRRNDCDSIIAIGGGSVIDTAKGVSVLISGNADNLIEFSGVEIIPERKVPFVVIPTTSGTGSEVTLVAVIKDNVKRVKLEFISYNLLPDVAILDPEMTLSMPPLLTASTGMDALVHAIEAYTCIQKNPLSDAYAFAAINLIREYLPEAIKDGKNKFNRLAMANASLMSGIAFSNSMVGIVHAIGHACGGISGVPHGQAMAILLPYGMEYNLEAVRNYFSELLLPLAGAKIYSVTPEKQRAEECIVTVKNMLSKLNRLCGLPLRLRDVGVKEEELGEIAEAAIDDGALMVNPQGADYEDVLLILKHAY